MSGRLQQNQDSYLNSLCGEQVAVAVHLVNCIKPQDQVLLFDRHAALLDNSLPRMVCKHAISTVSPARKANPRTTHESA